MRIGNDSLQLNGTDLANSIVSEPIWLGHIVNYSIQLFFTGTPNGSFSLQCSNDQGVPTAGRETPPADYKVTHYTTVANSTTSVSEAGDLTYDVQNAGYAWVRLVWTPNGGSTGTLTSYRFNIKGA